MLPNCTFFRRTFFWPTWLTRSANRQAWRVVAGQSPDNDRPLCPQWSYIFCHRSAYVTAVRTRRCGRRRRLTTATTPAAGGRWPAVVRRLAVCMARVRRVEDSHRTSSLRRLTSVRTGALVPGERNCSFTSYVFWLTVLFRIQLLSFWFSVINATTHVWLNPCWPARYVCNSTSS